MEMFREKNLPNCDSKGATLNNIFSRNKKILFLILTVTFITVIGAISYAFLPTDNLPNVPVDAQASTASLKLKYTDCATTNLENCSDISADLEPGDSIAKTFEIENIGTIDAKYHIYFRELENTFKNGDLVYNLENMSTGNVIVSNRPVPRGNLKNTLIKSGEVIDAGSKNQYKLTVTFLNRDYEQSDNYDATFSLKLKIDESLLVSDGTMMARIEEEKIWAHKKDIKNIVFENTINAKPDATYTYDLSDSMSAQDSVMAYLVPDSSDSTKYTAYIQANGGVKAPEIANRLFADFSNLESIEGLENFYTFQTTNMRMMFYECSKLKALDLSSFDTSNVTTMEGMFISCESLITLDLNNFDTTNLTDTRSMFYQCIRLETLELSNFDTSNVTSMSVMFYGCNSLTSLNVSNFNTSNVTNMSNMFSFCNHLVTLDLSNFDTSKVTNMSNMFAYNGALISININSFDTSNVTSMESMFFNCEMLKTLDVNNFDTSKVTTMKLMFFGCSSLTSLNISNFDTTNVTNMEAMFYNCSSLKTLDLGNFDTSNVETMSYSGDGYGMFENCKSLTTTITIKGTACTYYINMFKDAATESDVQITVNYTEDASSLVDQMISTKSDNSNVVKGSVVS